MKLRPWSIQEITRGATFVALWTVLSVLGIVLKIIMHEGYLPIFYFLIWCAGLLFSPLKAFQISFIGHFMFDLVYLPSPLFVFVWIASGLASMTIAWLRNQPYGWWLLFGLPTCYYLGAFGLMGYIQFNHWYKYFLIFPGITIMLTIVNPLFNGMVIFILRARPLFFRYLQSRCQPVPSNCIIKN